MAHAVGMSYPDGEALERPNPHDVYNRTPRGAFADFIGQYLKKDYLAMDEHPRQPGDVRFYLRPDFFERCAQGVQATQSEYERIEHTVAMAVDEFLVAIKADGRADLKDLDATDLWSLVKVAGDLPPAKLTPKMVHEVAVEVAKPRPTNRAPAKRIALPDMRPSWLRALREFIRWCVQEYEWTNPQWRKTIRAILELEASL
jgi:hypothetical protein